MESEMISCENVKPSSPTPPHLRTYKLSMFDQTMSEFLPLPVVLYFANKSTATGTDDDDDMVRRKTEQLKTSLSLTLTRYYPVAGRASADCQSVECNDQGVPFSVVYIKGAHKLSDPDLWAHLFPCSLSTKSGWGPGCHAAMIRVTHFECGALAIAIVFWHRMVDTVTVAQFLKYWAAKARGLDMGPGPNYSIPSLFPPKEELRKLEDPSPVVDVFVFRQYVFDGPAIRTLKAQLSSSAVESPSRVEVVTALHWKCYMVASLANHEKPPPASAIVHAVNLRRKSRPPLASEYFGNMLAYVVASYNNNNNKDNIGNDEDLLRHLVKKIRDATSKIDEEYVNRMRGDQGYSGFCENRKLVFEGFTEGADLLCFSSWCGMGFYDVDFGEGKPIWMNVSDGVQGASSFRNAILLMDTISDGGVVACLMLQQKYMNVFENVEHLKNHASATSFQSA